jgi:hypothetical protein
VTRWRLTVEYDGGPFMGWQRQDHGPSVQEALEQALFRMTGELATLHAAGRTELVFRWPGGLPADRVIGDQVRLVDLAPTILALAGLRPGDPMQGRDLSPLLRGGVLEPVPALIELLVDRNDVRGIRRQDSKTISWRHAGQSFLYDLLRDPREENPIGAPSGDLDRELAAIDGLLEEGFGLTRGAAPTRFEMAPHLRRRLGVLGYAGEETQDPEPRQN